MKRSPGFRRVSGFTLIELMVTIAIAAILLVVAVPGFVSFQRSSAVMSASTSFASALNVARAEAIKRSLSTFVQPQSNGDWATGWIVYVDANSNSQYDSASDPLLVTQQALPHEVSVPTANAPGFKDSADAVYVRYDSSGNPRAISTRTMTMPNSIDFTATGGSVTTTRRVVLNVVGRARTCDPIKNKTTCG